MMGLAELRFIWFVSKIESYLLGFVMWIMHSIQKRKDTLNSLRVATCPTMSKSWQVKETEGS